MKKDINTLEGYCDFHNCNFTYEENAAFIKNFRKQTPELTDRQRLKALSDADDYDNRKFNDDDLSNVEIPKYHLLINTLSLEIEA